MGEIYWKYTWGYRDTASKYSLVFVFFKIQIEGEGAVREGDISLIHDLGACNFDKQWGGEGKGN